MKIENKMNLCFATLIASLLIINANANHGTLMSKTWFLSCVPCLDILNECSSCLKDNCVTW